MMIEFKPPSLSAFRCRRVFHKCKRKQTEDYEEWFNRISDSMVNCSYGAFNDFMLIDKFMSGLNDYDLEQFSQKKLWSEKQLLLFIKELKLNSQKYVDSIENVDDLKIPKSVDAIKNEDTESGNKYNETGSIVDDNMSRDCKAEPNLVEYGKNELMLDTNGKIDLNADSSKINSDDGESKCRDFEIKRMLKQKQSTKNEHRTSYACELCNKDCLCRSKLEAHMQKHLHMGKTFECHLCGMYYPRLLGLKVHFKRMHIGSKKIKLHCTECDKTFLERVALERHIRIHKGLAQVYECPKCDKEFELRCRMKTHLARHSNIMIEELVCEICGQTKRSRKQLNMHQRTHSKVRYKCQICGLLLKNSNTHRIHQRQHTGERPHKCSLCPKSFVTAPSYKKHLMVHNKIKPHACSVCPGRFATPYHLKIHMNRHTGDKPFQCTQCKTRFSQPQSLNTHIKRFHQNDANQ